MFGSVVLYIRILAVSRNSLAKMVFAAAAVSLSICSDLPVGRFTAAFREPVPYAPLAEEESGDEGRDWPEDPVAVT